MCLQLADVVTTGAEAAGRTEQFQNEDLKCTEVLFSGKGLREKVIAFRATLAEECSTYGWDKIATKWCIVGFTTNAPAPATAGTEPATD